LLWLRLLTRSCDRALIPSPTAWNAPDLLIGTHSINAQNRANSRPLA